MVLANFCAFIVFCFYPCMPPRLLPESFGFKDTVRQDHAESVWTGGINVNQFAAMPSLHFTYAFIIGCTFIWHSSVWQALRGGRSRENSPAPIAAGLLVILGVLYPLLVLTVIVATANHYWLDAMVATLTVSIALMCNRVWLLLLPAERLLLRILRLRKPTPTTRSDTNKGRRRMLDLA